MIILWTLGGVFAAGFAAVALTPRRVAYMESVVIGASAAAIYDHVRFQDRLMRWSAWPSETGSTCRVEGTDGEIGARTVFLTGSGARFGHQEVVALDPGRRVDLALKSKGPPQSPRLSFVLEPLGAEETRVVLQFENTIAPPFNVILRAAGVVRWTRAMHRKDLAGLKAFAEPPHRTYAGAPVAELAA